MTMRRALLLAVATSVFVILGATPAWAHNADVEGRPVCTEAGERQITWTVQNDTDIAATVTWAGAGTFGENPTALASLGASQTLQQLPGETVGTVGVTAHVVWDDAFTQDPTGEVTIPEPCPVPPPPSTSTTATTVTSTTTTTTLPGAAPPPSDPGTPTPGPTLPNTGPSAERAQLIHGAKLAGVLVLLLGLTVLGLIALVVKPKRGDTLGR
jgi:hypothetical protein